MPHHSVQNRHRVLHSTTMALLLATVGTATLVEPVQAQTNPGFTININGTIQPGTCQLATSGGNVPVSLGTIKVSDLPASGVATPMTRFSLTVNQCDAGLQNAVFTFTGTASSDPMRFLNTGGAPGVAIELESTDDAAGTNPVNIPANGTNNSRIATISNGEATLYLQAGFWHLAGVNAGAGSVSGMVTVGMSYN